METKTMRRYAVLHVGSSNMSITILEYTSIDCVRVVDYASREVTFGEELFQTSRLSFETIDEICQVLRGYKRLMADYGVQEARLYGTTVIREAKNRRIILEQIFIHTGLRVEVIDMPKEVYYKYFWLYYDMQKHPLQRAGQPLMFVDITSGGVGITVWKGSKILFQHNIHSGSLRVIESFKRNQRASMSFPRAVAEYLRHILLPLEAELKSLHIDHIIFAGDEAQFLASCLGMGKVGDEAVSIPAQQVTDFVDSFHGLSVSKLMNRYHLPEFKANIMMPTLILYREIIQLLAPTTVLVSGISFSEGISLYYGAEKEDAPYLHLLREQNVEIARSIARRYNTDPVHNREVERFAMQFSDALKDQGVPERWGYLARIAALLCDVGKFVNLRNHGEHAYQIIMGSDIFGLSDEEKEVVATVVYYHYKGIPSDEDAYFDALTEYQKIAVIKLAAIMRMAIALDAGGNQKIQRIRIERQQGSVLVTAYTSEDISLERWTFEREAAFFAAVFGMPIQLAEGGDW